jgi:hypothetical protein
MKRFVVLMAIAMAGCANESAQQIPQPALTPAHSGKSQPQSGSPGAPQPGVPAAAPAGAPAAAPSEERLAALQEAYDRNPSDAKTKAELVEVLLAGGNYFMYTDEVDRKVKYRKALALYRRAEKLVPGNETAREGIEQIEAIYKQMNLPVPEV